MLGYFSQLTYQRTFFFFNTVQIQTIVKASLRMGAKEDNSFYWTGRRSFSWSAAMAGMDIVQRLLAGLFSLHLLSYGPSAKTAGTCCGSYYRQRGEFLISLLTTPKMQMRRRVLAPVSFSKHPGTTTILYYPRPHWPQNSLLFFGGISQQGCWHSVGILQN